MIPFDFSAHVPREVRSLPQGLQVQERSLPVIDVINPLSSKQQTVQPVTFADVKVTRPFFKGSVEDYVMITNFKRFKRKGSSSKYKGVFYVKKEKKFRAQICLKGKKKYIGTFKNDFDAAIARDKHIREKYGEVEELLNFPSAQPEHLSTSLITEQQLLAAHLQNQQESLRKFSLQYGASTASPSSLGALESAMYRRVLTPYLSTNLHAHPGVNLGTSVQDPTSLLFTASSYSYQPSASDAAALLQTNLLLSNQQKHDVGHSEKRMKTRH